MKRVKLLWLLCFTMLSLQSWANADIRPVYLRTEYKVNPFVEEASPRLSWELRATGFNQNQQAYRILVASSISNLNKHVGDLWDSYKVTSNATNQISYKGKALKPGQKVYWKVKVWNDKNEEGLWSTINSWELAKPSKSEWQAEWIGKDLNHLAPKGEYHLPPSPYLRKEVKVTKPVKSARLYISSLGLHNFYINGEKIGKDFFGSGWTEYNKRVYYNVYDVSKNLQQGNNAFGAILSSGWYSGYLAYALLVGTPQVDRFYGNFPLLKAQVDVEYADGTKEVFYTDQSWKTGVGAVIESDFLQGETHDARKDPKGWNKVGFDDSQWTSVEVVADKADRALEIYPSNPVRIVEELPIKSIKKIEDGKYLIDFGQNFAGNIRLKHKAKAGDKLVFRFGEMLHIDGKLVTENLRRARAIDTYIFRGDAQPEVWSPSFTFHGFQFVEVSGLKEAPKADFLTGLALSSDLETAGSFKTDNAMLNQLYSNIVWTQRANYIDIPTDCPQRDERIGWTGDAQIYMRSATFNNDVAPFHKKWIKDLNDSQWENGTYPVYAPMPKNSKGLAAIRPSDTYSPGWSEAGIICTYEIFKGYNDLRIVEESLPYMTKFMDFLKSKAPNGAMVEGIWEDATPKGGFGDWLSVGQKTSPDLVANTYYYYCTKLMAEMTRAIGKNQLADAYTKELDVIRAGFKKHYMDANGKLKIDEKVYGNGDGYVEGQNGFSGHTQTAYANAIYSGILEGEDAEKAGQYLRDLVQSNGDKLTTGFLGFKPLLPALSKTGSGDKAYKLILSEEYPSLGYEVANGATSIWERWDSFTKDKGFVHNAAMNSFSHYAFGSVNEWMFQNLLGISATANGYSQIQIKPEINAGINEASGSYHSISGKISSSWKKSGNKIVQQLEIPVNVKATCYFPTANAGNILINGKPLNSLSYVSQVKSAGNQVSAELGSGKYEVVITN